jgi:hypothetical protein
MRCSFAAIFALSCSTAASASTGDGPLQIATEGTFDALFLEMTLADARSLAEPELDVRWSLGNDWSVPSTILRGGRTVLLQADEQTDSLRASLRAPWSRLLGPGPRIGGRPLWGRLSTAFEAGITAHWGGWTDRPVEAWHHLIGSTNFEREMYPRNAVNVTLFDASTGAGADLRSAHLTLGDLVLRTQLLLAEGGASVVAADPSRWGVSARFDFKVPVGNAKRLGGSGGWDVGVGILGSVEIASWLTAHAMAGVAAYSAIGLPVALQPRTCHYSAEVSLAVRLGAYVLLLEDRVTSPLFEGGWTRVDNDGNTGFISSAYYGVFRSQNQVSGGVRRGRLTFWLSEDWTPGYNPHGAIKWFYNSNQPDLAIGLAYSRRL